ncbi:MAG TPA: hypothetical protein VMC07_02580 [Candidatus Omnitrophota bacterium]|nr:hypothetical protein [Candidatus Omnitrophota bacterium]
MADKKISHNEHKEEAEHHASQKELVKHENKILRNILLVIGLLALLFVGYLVASYFITHFDYKGVQFTVVSDQWVGLLYNTKIPSIYQNQSVNFNLYLRNDPRKTAKDVPFDGQLVIRPFLVINSTDNFNCNGDGVIGIANLENLYGAMGVKTGNANATCDPLQRYVSLKIETSNETKIIETAPACYTMEVNNCEILKATERYMIETFVQLHNSSA